ncbi:MAG: dynamin family protein, partial [Syntrophorhabdus sp.]
MDDTLNSSGPIQVLANPILNHIQQVTEKYNMLPLVRQIEACRDLVEKNSLIDVAILGQFKAGKSSFLNSIIGKPILPVGVIPVTTVITRLA